MTGLEYEREIPGFVDAPPAPLPSQANPVRWKIVLVTKTVLARLDVLGQMEVVQRELLQHRELEADDLRMLVEAAA